MAIIPNHSNEIQSIQHILVGVDFIHSRNRSRGVLMRAKGKTPGRSTTNLQAAKPMYFVFKVEEPCVKKRVHIDNPPNDTPNFGSGHLWVGRAPGAEPAPLGLVFERGANLRQMSTGSQVQRRQ